MDANGVTSRHLASRVALAVAPRDRLGEGDHFPGRRSVTRAKAHGARAEEGRTCGRATLRATVRERNAKGARIEATDAAQTQAAAIVGYRAGGGVPEPLNAVKTRVAFESRRRGLPCRATCVTAEGGQGNLEAPSEMPSRERKDRAHSRVPRATRAIVCARASGFQRFRDGFARVTKHTPTDFRQSHPQPRKAKSKISRPSDSAGDRHPNKEEWESFGLPYDFRRENRPTRNRHFDSSFQGSRRSTPLTRRPAGAFPPLFLPRATDDALTPKVARFAPFPGRLGRMTRDPGWNDGGEGARSLVSARA